MPFVSGGELYMIFLSQQKKFTEETVKFYAAQLVLAISELHSKGVLYRDLKIENVLMDSKGFLKLIDYGHCQILMFKDTQVNSKVEEGEYTAPEMF
jgi:serine/threonine protein kinase